jgi:hypothetical protein
LLSSQFISFINSGTSKIFKKKKQASKIFHWFFLKTTKKSINIDYNAIFLLHICSLRKALFVSRMTRLLYFASLFCFSPSARIKKQLEKVPLVILGYEKCYINFIFL